MSGDSRHEFVNLLTSYEQKSQESYDKALMTLSGGALGITFAFIKDIVGGPAQAQWNLVMLGAWACWIFSLGAVVASFYSSQRAHKSYLEKVHLTKASETLPDPTVSRWTRAVPTLNFLSGLLFMLGLILALLFIWKNLGDLPMANETKKTTTTEKPAGETRGTRGQEVPVPSLHVARPQNTAGKEVLAPTPAPAQPQQQTPSGTPAATPPPAVQSDESQTGQDGGEK